VLVTFLFFWWYTVSILLIVWDVVRWAVSREGTAKFAKEAKGEKRIEGKFQPIRVSYDFVFLVVYGIDFVNRLGCGAGWQWAEREPRNLRKTRKGRRGLEGGFSGCARFNRHIRYGKLQSRSRSSETGGDL
jgi:hypothetical protein